jgi:hypothetical protein
MDNHFFDLDLLHKELKDANIDTSECKLGQWDEGSKCNQCFDIHGNRYCSPNCVDHG